MHFFFLKENNIIEKEHLSSIIEQMNILEFDKENYNNL